ncbi:hypothetical protein J1614_009196 [Plenodomus biglobosus]|nr:hypothetical protein J1614_009196 [Plenodomus biglobosus]
MAVSQNDAIDKWGHDSAAVNQSAHNIGNNTDQDFFEYIRESSFRSEKFAELMSYLFKIASRGNERLLGLYDWASLGNCTMVDVGGSTGHCSVFVARCSPAINFIIQDLPLVVARSSDPETSTVPLDLQNRISFQAHNIMESQPVVAEVYFLRMILHDWSDPDCEKVFSHLAAAMEKKPGSRSLIVDSILPRPGTLPTVVERPMRAADLQMGLVFNGKERHYEEWESLLRRGHPLLAIKRVVQEDQGPMAIIEVSLKLFFRSITKEA